ncbi:MAG: PDZ domain-containing protein [Luteitalea sp.]|nr:PDZ domain-containing protein [Luteitalea sp.]
MPGVGYRESRRNDIVSSQSLWQQLSGDIAAQVQRAAASVVRIDVASGRPATGLIVAPDLVIAADHALAADDELAVTRDDQRVPGAVVGRDPVSDLVVLRASGLGGSPLTLAATLPQVGEIVLALWRDWRGGVAAGLSVVAGLPGPFRVARGTSLDVLIRTTLLPARGVSGGAILDANGRVAGMSTAGLARGSVVALPAAVVRHALEELQAHGRIRRGYVGVALQRVRLPADQRVAEGKRTALLVVGVEEEGPAASAGVRIGDLVVGCDGEQLSDIEELQAALRPDRVGQSIELDLLRGGSTLRLAVTVGERGRRAA